MEEENAWSESWCKRRLSIAQSPDARTDVLTYVDLVPVDREHRDQLVALTAGDGDVEASAAATVWPDMTYCM